MALDIAVGSFTRPAAGTTNTVISGLAFVPKAIVFLASNGLTAGTWRAGLESAIGWAAKPLGDSVVPVSVGAYQGANNAAAPSSRLGIGVVSTRQVDGAGTVTASIATVAFGASSVTIDWTNSPYDTEQEHWGYIVMGGDVLAATATTVATKEQLLLGATLNLAHNLGFLPSAALIAAANTDTPSSESIGSRAGGGQWALSLSDQQGLNPSNVKRRLSNDCAVHLVHPVTGATYLKMLAEIGSGGTALQIAGKGTLGSWALQSTKGLLGAAPNTMSNPSQVAVDSTGRILVADTGNNRLLIFTSAGAYAASIASLTGITGVCVDSSDNIYIARTSSGVHYASYTSALASRWVYDIPASPVTTRHCTTDGTTVWFTHSGNAVTRLRASDGAALLGDFGGPGSGNGLFNNPWGIAYNSTDSLLYVVDSGNSRVQAFNTSGTYQRQWAISSSARGCAIDVTGNVMVAEYASDIVKRYNKTTGALIDSFAQTDPDGIAVATGDVPWVSNVGGNTLAKWDEVGGFWTLQQTVTSWVTFNTPGQVALDPLSGDIFVCDTNNNRVVRITSAGVYVSQKTGLTAVSGIAFSSSGQVGVIYDTGNSFRIYSSNTLVSSVATLGADANQTFQHVTADATYFYLTNYDADTVVRIPLTGSIKTTFGSAGAGNLQFNNPWGIVVSGGELYIVDAGNSRVQVLTAAGAYVRQWAISASARGIAIDSFGNVLVAEYGSDIVKRYTNTGTLLDSFAQTDPDGIAVLAGNVVWVGNITGHNVALWDETESVTFSVLYLGGIAAAAGVTNKPTSGAPAAMPITTGVKVKTALLFADMGPTVNTTSDHMRLAAGLSDGTVHRALAVQVQDNLGTSNSDVLFSNAAAMLKGDNATATLEAQATASFTSNNLALSWNPNDAVATPIAWLALGDPGPSLAAYMPAYGMMVPDRVGTPHALSSVMEQSLLMQAVLGDSGTLGSVAMASTSTMAAGLGLQHLMTCAMACELVMLPVGLKLNRPLDAAMDGGLAFGVGKLGVDAPLASTLMAAVSGMSVLGIKLDRPLSSVMGSVLDMYPRFKVPLPTIAKAGPNDIPGTVNWHQNPSAEFELTGWLGRGNATVAAVTTQAWDGIKSVQVTTTTGATGTLVAKSVAGLFLTGLNDVGDHRTIWGYLHLKQGTVPGQTLTIKSRARYEDTTFQEGELATITLTADWQAYYAPGLVIDPAKMLDYIEIEITTPAAISSQFYADGAQMEEDRGQGPSAWTIGGYGRETGYWVATPHVSVSGRDPIRRDASGTGRGGDVVIDVRLYRATYDNQWLEDVSDAVISATVQMNPERESTWGLDATLTWEGYQRLLINQDWLAPVFTVYYADGTVSTGQLGLYFLVPSETERGEYSSTVKLSAFDPLWLLGRQGLLAPYVARPGTDRIQHVNKILDEAIFTGGDQNARRWALTNSNKEFKKRHEWPRKTSRLEIANDILESSGFWPLFTTGQGIITSRKMGPERVADRAPVRAWTAHLPAGESVASWVPRINAANSGIVGTVKTVPKAHDMFDEILLISGDFDGQNLGKRGKIKGPRKNAEEERDHHNQRQKEKEKNRNNSPPRQQRLEDRREARDEKREERREDRRELRDERQDDRREDRGTGGRDKERDDRNRRDRRDKKHRNNHHDDNEHSNRDKQDSDRTHGQGKGRSRTRRIYAPLVDDEATAAEIAAALSDDLSNRTQGVTISVLPDPAPNYVRESVYLNIHDAYGEEVVIGKFLVRSIKWGFTPGQCLQEMDLDYVDEGTAVIEVT